jgi:hypothetical protein
MRNLNFRGFMLVFTFALIIILFLLFGLGSYVSNKCSTVGNCKQCWNEFNLTEKNNAYADMIVCMCTADRNKNFADNELNGNIEIFYRAISGISGNATNICEGNLPFMKLDDTEESNVSV